jgi:hypothetical protein
LRRSRANPWHRTLLEWIVDMRNIIESDTAIGAIKRKWLAEQIDAAASGEYFSQNALKEVKQLSFLKLNDHIAVNRYLQGCQIAQDNWTLQQISIKLRYLYETNNEVC